MRMYDLILKKRNGGTLTEDEITYMIDGYTREEIRREISGNFCRCTGYENILNAIEKALQNNEPEGGGA